MSNSLWPHRLHSPWNSPGQNTGVGSLSLLQGSNLGLSHCRRILYQLTHKGSPSWATSWAQAESQGKLQQTNWLKEGVMGISEEQSINQKCKWQPGLWLAYGGGWSCGAEPLTCGIWCCHWVLFELNYRILTWCPGISWCENCSQLHTWELGIRTIIRSLRSAILQGCNIAFDFFSWPEEVSFRDF